jgi:hypothetical protein
MMEQDEWDNPPRQLPTAAGTTWVKQVRQALIQRWQPEPLPPPVVDVELPKLCAIERAAEVLRHNCCCLEHWISPNGALREWLKLNLRLAFGIGIPALLVAPLVTFALKQFRNWIDVITQTTSNLVLVPLSVLLVVGLIGGLFYIGRSLLIMRLRYQQQRRDPYNF